MKVSPNDFSKSEELIKRTYQSTQKWFKMGNLESNKVPKLMKFHNYCDEMEEK